MTTMSDDTLRRVIDFNFFPSLEMDDSWWESDWLATPLIAGIKNVKAAHRKLSDFILESYQMKRENYFDFGSYERQAALLSSVDLKALLYKIGLVIESNTIANVIERKAQQAIKKSLGEADYLYALKNRISIDYPRASNKVLPAVEQSGNGTDFKNYIHQSGLRCLLGLLDNMPQGFIQRLLFKLPKSWSDISRGNEDDYQAIRTYLPRLLKEVNTP